MTKGKIFIIDDSDVVLDVARHLLVTAGYAVETCNNPLAAARPLRKFEPDLVLVDINMPSIKGDVVARVLSAQLNGAPILLHSDIEPEEQAERARQAGASGFIRKTFDPNAFLEQIEHWISRR